MVTELIKKAIKLLSRLEFGCYAEYKQRIKNGEKLSIVEFEQYCRALVELMYDYDEEYINEAVKLVLTDDNREHER